MKLGRVGLLVGIYFAIQSCGSDQGSELKGQVSTPSFGEASFGNDSVYQVHVAGQDYPAALKRTCQILDMDCTQISYGRTSLLYNNLAETSAISNRIRVQKMSFYKLIGMQKEPPQTYEDRYHLSDIRALAVILTHERFHQQNQPQMQRYGAARAAQFLRRPSAQYQLELDAWRHTVNWTKTLGFEDGDTREKLLYHWVQGMVSEYRQLLDNPNVDLN